MFNIWLKIRHDGTVVLVDDIVFGSVVVGGNNLAGANLMRRGSNKRDSISSLAPTAPGLISCRSCPQGLC